MDEWQTKDIFEASWIYSQNIPLLRLIPDTRYFWFVFQDKKLCEQLSCDYWQQNATGNIKNFVNSLKTLKDLVFSKNLG
jgi:hypothetical protein